MTNKYIIIPEEEAVLDKETAWVKNLYSDGKKIGRKQYYFEFGDENQSAIMDDDNLAELKIAWMNISYAINNQKLEPDLLKLAPKRLPEDNNIFKKSSSEILRKILNED